jgi:hypothetical protein
MSALTSLERRAIERALSGSEPWKSQLLSQVDGLRVLRREDTGSGFYTDFAVPVDALPAEVPADVYSIPPQSVATHPAISGEVFFLVWLKDGRIDCLECASGVSRLPETGEFVFA